MKELKDYLYLYLGCEVMIEEKYKCKLTGFENGKPTVLNLKSWDGVKVNEWHLIKPILRHLFDMTEEEVINLVWQKSTVYLNVRFVEFWGKRVRFEFEYKSSSRRRIDDVSFDELNPTQFTYLLKQGLDLFGLIESGLAINKNDLPTDDNKESK